MRAVVLVPYRAAERQRERNWKVARQFWHRLLPIPTFVGDGGGEFSRAAARNEAARLAGDWDVALFADADILLDSPLQAEVAIERAFGTGAYTVAFSVLRYVTERGLLAIRAGRQPHEVQWDEEVGQTWECCFAVRRDLWDEIGGFDERFQGYGGQGIAFYYAAATLGGRERIDGAAYHLPHPLADRGADPHFKANMELVARYMDAVDDLVAMRAVIQETR